MAQGAVQLFAPVKVSVVVPTYCRPEALSNCLDALEAQERHQTRFSL